MSLLNNSFCITKSKTNNSQNIILIYDTNNLGDNNKSFTEVFNEFLNNAPDMLKKNTKSPDNNSINYNDIVAKGGKTDEELVKEAKAQEKLNLDIQWIAKMLGIPPALAKAVIGKIDINPNNLNFNINTNVDEAVNSIAQYFGISPMTLLAIFDKLKIDPNNLEYKEEMGKILNKLKDFFYLNKNQEKELKEIMNKFATKSKLDNQ